MARLLRLLLPIAALIAASTLAGAQYNYPASPTPSPSPSTGATYDPCDTNKDGTLDPNEQSACKGGAPAYPCGDTRSGFYGDCEKDPCPPASGGPGTMEQSSCAPACDPRLDVQCPANACDANKDGMVDEREKAACVPPEKPAPVTDDCRAALNDLDAKRKAFYQDQQERRDAFGRQQAQEAQQFGQAKHTDEEWAAFKAKLDRDRLEFEKRLQSEADAFEASNESPAACKDQGGPSIMAMEGKGDCTPTSDAYDKLKIYIAHQERAWSEQAAAKRAAFEQYQRDQRFGFAADNPNPEQQRAFDDGQARERAAFEAGLQMAALAHRAELDMLWLALKQKLAMSCTGPSTQAPANTEPAVQKDARADRFACKLGFEEKFNAFFAQHGKDPQKWTEAQWQQLMEMKKAVLDQLAQCEEMVHQAWKQQTQEELQPQEPKDRLGGFRADRRSDTEGTLAGRYVRFDYAYGSLTLRDYAVQGVQLFERFDAPHRVDPYQVDGNRVAFKGTSTSDGPSTQVADKGAPRGFSAESWDNPGGNFRADCLGSGPSAGAGGPGACTLVLPEQASVTRMDESAECAAYDPKGPSTCGPSAQADTSRAVKYRVQYGQQRAHLVVTGTHAWSGRTLTVDRELALALVPGATYTFGWANQYRGPIKQAYEEGKVLGEFDVVGPEPRWNGVALSPAAASVVTMARKGTSGVAIDVTATSERARTLVFNLDRTLFASVSPSNLGSYRVLLYDVAADGAASAVSLVRANDLQDALTPGAQAKFWVVADANGVQVIVSVDHFSTKRVEVESTSAEATPAPARTPGFEGLAALGAAGAVALAARRRR